MPLSPFLGCFVLIPSYVYYITSVRRIVECVQCFHRNSTAVDLGRRNVADSLKMKARAALATHMAVISLGHVRVMIPALLSFLLQNKDLQSAVF